MTNKAIAQQLKLAGNLVELSGGNPFKARAFGSAARAVEKLEGPAADLAKAGTLDETYGIGKSIARDIAELVETGELASVTEMLAAIPPGLLDVLKVKGLGPKKVRALWQEIDITSLDDLQSAAVTGRLAELPGFGSKTAENVLSSIAKLQEYAGKVHYGQIHDDITGLVEALQGADGLANVEATGDFRRQLDVVELVELVIEGDQEAVLNVLASNGCLMEDAEGDSPLHGQTSFGLPLAVHIATPDSFGTILWATTGSQEHVEAFTERFGEPGNTDDEELIYDNAGLREIPPSLREGLGEINAAEEDILPDLLTLADLKGTLHNHTTYSDGAHTLREMAGAARAMGLEYFGVCDHSRSLQIAHGLPIEKLMEQLDAIAELNEEYANDGGLPFRIFSGTECDVLPDGSMDYPDEVLEKLDVVVASIHTNFGLSEAKQTQRMLNAAANPHVDILGHLTGRLLLKRDGYPINHEAVIEACAETNTCIELNANPWRLDLDWRWIRRATDAGIPIAINPDAHSMEQLKLVRWGVAVAQKGWLTAEQCLNCMPADELAAWLHGRNAAV